MQVTITINDKDILNKLKRLYNKHTGEVFGQKDLEANQDYFNYMFTNYWKNHNLYYVIRDNLVSDSQPWIETEQDDNDQYGFVQVMVKEGVMPLPTDNALVQFAKALTLFEQKHIKIALEEGYRYTENKYWKKQPVDYGQHLCSNGNIMRPYAAVLCSMCKES